MHLVVVGSVDRVIKVAVVLEVQRIVSQEADLEDDFLKYYTSEEE